MTVHSKQNIPWTSKMFGKGTIAFWEDFNSGINAEITIESIHMDLGKFPKIAKISLPAETKKGQRFTLDVDMETVKTWMTMIAIGVPVIVEQRISFR